VAGAGLQASRCSEQSAGCHGQKMEESTLRAVVLFPPHSASDSLTAVVLPKSGVLHSPIIVIELLNFEKRYSS